MGIVFLGTPHRGSGAATLGQVAALIAGAAVPGLKILNRALIKNLERDNEGLFQISNRFSNICGEMRIHSYYETRGGRMVSSSPEHCTCSLKLIPFFR